MYTHESMAAIARNATDMSAPYDRVLFTLPFPHLGYMGWIYNFTRNRVTLVLGPAAVVGAREPARSRPRSGSPMMTGVPTQWALVLDRADVEGTDLSHLRIVAVGRGRGAARADPTHARDARRPGAATATRRPRPA